MSDPAPSTHISMAANLGGFELGRLQARQFLLAHSVDAASLAACELVLEECVTNTLRYGYACTGLRWIELEIAVFAGEIQLTLEDDAQAFDPLSVPEPALPASLEEAQIGGLGLLIVRRSVQSLRYERVGGRNRLCACIARSH